ncbi:MAG: DUF5654 family protein [Candidatus Methanomethylophilaceae archaeon]|jgi:hypothetical protein|nr:DUF5654 family protein [Candidatus Methanomethylophilaceae archaeon]NLF33479.1 hypothetical protein [Thermoplasmatales archaeon]
MSNKFKVQLLETTVALITAAFGLVAALAWNDAIKALIKSVFPDTGGELIGLFVYATLVTIIAVVATLLIARSLSKAKKALGEEGD